MLITAFLDQVQTLISDEVTEVGCVVVDIGGNTLPVNGVFLNDDGHIEIETL